MPYSKYDQIHHILQFQVKLVICQIPTIEKYFIVSTNGNKECQLVSKSVIVLYQLNTAINFCALYNITYFVCITQ